MVCLDLVEVILVNLIHHQVCILRYSLHKNQHVLLILGSIEKDKWYKVHMYIKSNTGNNANGHVQIKINGETVIDQNILWTTNDSKRFINNLSFHT